MSSQLGGENKAPNTLGTCAPQQYFANTAGFDDLPDNAAIDPCGLMPYSYFNDSYTLTSTPAGGGTSTAVVLDVGPLSPAVAP